MPKTLKISRDFVRAMLASHSILGLTVAGLMYLICVTGTLSVFYPQIERWEQPRVAETAVFDPQAIQAAVREVLKRTPERPDRVFVSLPTEEVPRVAVATGDVSGFLQPDGSLGERVDHEWTHFLVRLHYALTLPNVLGLALVGVLGIMLTAMVISGLLAHPNIFKDAFSFRLGGAQRLQQVDIHNRLSVWTAPFQLAIALTGAFIGLSQVFAFVLSAVFFEGDVETATRSLFLQHAEPTGIEAPLADVGAALERFRTDHPGVRPMSLTLHEPGTTAQAIEISARVPRRLVWGEFYMYSADGELVKQAGWSNGDTGVQLYASTYRLHFGHFAGLSMQLAYLALGVALCIVTGTGVNIWLLRRAQAGRPAERAQRLWTATLWGVPLAIVCSALGDVVAGINGTLSFWVVLSLLLIAGWRAPDVRASSRRLRLATAVVAAGIVIAHVVRFGAAAFNEAALLMNLFWTATALAFIASLFLRLPRAASAPAPAAHAAGSRIESA